MKARNISGDFPPGPVTSTLHFHYKGHDGFDPLSRNSGPTSGAAQSKKAALIVYWGRKFDFISKCLPEKYSLITKGKKYFCRRYLAERRHHRENNVHRLLAVPLTVKREAILDWRNGRRRGDVYVCAFVPEFTDKVPACVLVDGL